MPGNSSYRIWRASWLVFTLLVFLSGLCTGIMLTYLIVAF